MDLSAAFEWIWSNPIVIFPFLLILWEIYKSTKPYPEGADTKVKLITTEKDLKGILETLGDAVLILEFYARWCPPCKSAAPFLDQWSKEYDQADFLFAKVDVDTSRSLATQFKVAALPTFKVLDCNGKELKSFAGWRKKHILEYLSEKGKKQN